MKLRTCVSPEGKFTYGIHKPSFKAANLRENDLVQVMGLDSAGEPVDNRPNFPDGDVEELQGGWIYEIPNPFPFRGTTYIDKSWAAAKADDPMSIRLLEPPPTSMTDFLCKTLGCKADRGDILDEAFAEAAVALTAVICSAENVRCEPHALTHLDRGA